MNTLPGGHQSAGEGSTSKRRKRRNRKRRNRQGQMSEQNIASENGENSTSANSEAGGGDGPGNHKSSARVRDVNGQKKRIGRDSAHARDDGHSNDLLSNNRDKEANKVRPRYRNAQSNSRKQRKNLYAALDLGTNNCRLLIVLPQEQGRFRVIDGFSRIVRLGEGLTQTGELSDAAMARALEALKICATKLRSRGIRRQRLIATEACRQALNGQNFLETVKSETGLELEIVNRETEARLAAEGCGVLIDRKADAAVLFDIGGGSSELILVDRRKNKRGKISDHIASWTSLPMGVVTLAERFGGKEVTRELFDEMVAHVLEHIDQFEDKDLLSDVFNNGRVHLLGTSGTVTTLAGIHLNLPKYDRKRVDGIWLNDQQMNDVITRLISMTYHERAKNPCIGMERADLVLAGCAILNAIRQYWPAKRLRVADRGLREGLLTQMMSADNAWIKSKKNRWSHQRRNRQRGE